MEPPKNLRIVSEQDFYAKDQSIKATDINLSKDLLNEYIFLIFCLAVLVMVYCLYIYANK